MVIITVLLYLIFFLIIASIEQVVYIGGSGNGAVLNVFQFYLFCSIFLVTVTWCSLDSFTQFPSNNYSNTTSCKDYHKNLSLFIRNVSNCDHICVRNF